jgi:hypothetical protein
MSKRRAWKWTEHQLDKLNKVLDILEELKDYKPLTLRQVYYQLVGKGYIENNLSQYGMLSNLLKYARIEGRIAWEDIEDRVRTYHDLTGWETSEDYIKASLKQFLNNYQRDLLQSQDVYLEIWIEKDALSSIFTRVARPYTIPVVVCRGFSSVSFLNDYKTRLTYYPGRSPILLYFGDFDPSGVEMLKAMVTTLEDELKVTGIAFKRVALLKEDIVKYRLPHSPEALKHTDTRAERYVAEYGELAVELDALSPMDLEAKIREAIEQELDMELYDEEVGNESQELDKLSTIKAQVNNLISLRSL